MHIQRANLKFGITMKSTVLTQPETWVDINLDVPMQKNAIQKAQNILILIQFILPKVLKRRLDNMKLQKIQNVRFCTYSNSFDISSLNRRTRIRKHVSQKVVYVAFFNDNGVGILNGCFNEKFPQTVQKFQKMFSDLEKS